MERKGMTLKQINRHCFLRLVRADRELRSLIRETGLQSGDFAILARISIGLHAAKGDVPRWMWRLTREG